jgi:hypothetical protein
MEIIETDRVIEAVDGAPVWLHIDTMLSIRSICPPNIGARRAAPGGAARVVARTRLRERTSLASN